MRSFANLGGLHTKINMCIDLNALGVSYCMVFAYVWGAVLVFIPYLWISIIHLWISIFIIGYPYIDL